MSCHFPRESFLLRPSHEADHQRSPQRARHQKRQRTFHCLNNRYRLILQSERGGCCTCMKDISVWPIKTGDTFMRSPARWRGAACSSDCFRSNFHQERCICSENPSKRSRSPFSAQTTRMPDGKHTTRRGVARVHRQLRGGGVQVLPVGGWRSVAYVLWLILLKPR